MLSFCCQLTGIGQSNPRAQLSFPGIHIPTPKHPFATSAREVTIFPGSQLSDEPGHSQFLASTEECAVVQLEEKKGFQKYYHWFSACNTEVTSSCVSGSLSNSQLYCKVTFQPKNPIIFGKKGTVSTDGCCMLVTSHAADPSEICAAHTQTSLGVEDSKTP